MKAKYRGRVEALRDARHVGDDGMTFSRRDDRWRLADSLEQEFANLAGVPVENVSARRYRSFLRLLALVVMAAAAVPMRVRDNASHILMRMMMIVRDEFVQTFAKQRNAGISCQQRASQKFSQAEAHGKKAVVRECGSDVILRCGAPSRQVMSTHR